jgi:hypothetical protein
MPTLRSYLVDGDGDYILADPSDPNSRIQTGAYIYGVTDTSWQRVASAVHAHCGVKSFTIRHKIRDDKWHLKINQHQHIGIFPSQDAAIQVLLGLFIQNSGSALGADAAASLQLSVGRSSIDVSDGPSGDETVLDTYITTGQVWRAGNNWWNNLLDNGAWDSTGTGAGTYFDINNSSTAIRTDSFKSGLPTATPVPAGAKVRLTFDGQTGALPLGVLDGQFGDTRYKFTWEGGDVAASDLEESGGFGFSSGVPLTIELIAP